MLLGLIQSLSVSQPPWSQVEQVKQEQAHRSTSSEEKGFPASTQPLPLPKIAVGSVLLSVFVPVLPQALNHHGIQHPRAAFSRFV